MQKYLLSSLLELLIILHVFGYRGSCTTQHCKNTRGPSSHYHHHHRNQSLQLQQRQKGIARWRAACFRQIRWVVKGKRRDDDDITDDDYVNKSRLASSTSSAFPLPSSVSPPEPLENEQRYMRRALELAALGLGKTRPNPVVGCVIVDASGQIVGEGYHPKAGEPHAEVWALRQAGANAIGATAYVTLEPCNHYGRTPPCTDALLQAGITRVVAGMVDPDPRTAGSGLNKLASAGVDVMVGVEGSACYKINAPFVHRIAYSLPYGVLHCSINPQEDIPRTIRTLAQNKQKGDDLKLTFLLSHEDYHRCDAVVVQGERGVRSLDAAGITDLPAFMLRVVLADSLQMLESTRDSQLWTHMPNATVVLLPSVHSGTGNNENGGGGGSGDEDVNLAASFLADGSVDVVNLQPGLSTAEAIVKYLHSRSLLSFIWQVDNKLMEEALKDGYVQRIVVKADDHSIGDVSGGGGGLPSGLHTTIAENFASELSDLLGREDAVSVVDDGDGDGTDGTEDGSKRVSSSFTLLVSPPAVP